MTIIQIFNEKNIYFLQIKKFLTLDLFFFEKKFSLGLIFFFNKKIKFFSLTFSFPEEKKIRPHLVR